MTQTRGRGTLFERLREGLEEAIAYTQGKRRLRAVVVPDAAPDIRPQDIVRLRNRFGVDPALFARMLNVSPKTLRSWEQGVRRPSAGSLRLLQLFNERPEVVSQVIGVPQPGARTRTATR